jgi:hypothetical protein
MRKHKVFFFQCWRDYLGNSEITIDNLFIFLTVTRLTFKRFESDISYQSFLLFMVFFLHVIANEFATIGQDRLSGLLVQIGALVI